MDHSASCGQDLRVGQFEVILHHLSAPHHSNMRILADGPRAQPV